MIHKTLRNMYLALKGGRWGDLDLGTGASPNGLVKVDRLTESTTGAGTTLASGATISASKTLAVTTADKLTVGGIIVDPYVRITHKINPANTSGEFCFIADRAYTVVSISEVHNVVAGQACACAVRKITAAATLADAAAGATVIELLASNFDLTSTAGTTVAGSLSVTASDLNLAAGNKIGVKMGNGTSLVGGNITIVLKPI